MSKVEVSKPVVLITGVSGLIGERIAKDLSADYTVVGLDVQKPEEGSALADWIDADLTDEASVRDALQAVRKQFGSNIASVIHLAAYYDFSGEPSPLYNELTVEGTRRLLAELRDFEVEQFVFSSSLLAMKPSEDGKPLTEDSPTQGEWAYPQSKLEAEAVIRGERGNIPAVILRIAGVYDEQGHSLPIGQQIHRIYEKQLESHFFPGDTDRGQSFLHLDDLVRCVRLVVEHRGTLEGEEVFLIGEPDVMSYEELQNSIGELLHGKEWTTVEIPKFVAKAGAYAKNKLGDAEDEFIKPWMVDLADQHYPVDSSKARDRLGWEAGHRLRDTLPKIVGFLKQDPKKWYEVNNLPMPEELKAK